ncbi:MAG: HNH endonuclease [Verrucomicrobia bacterium]|nr:HNH endonuclease [Verrucomicrobiota bacterium]
MARVEAYRLIVVARAGGACEYCRLLEAATGVTFHIEHIVPQMHGGKTLLDNLALSCPGCNLAKGDRVSAKDRRGRDQPLFNPRAVQSWLLGWHLHFILDRENGLISARSPTGEATIGALRMNDANRLFARRLQIQAGLIA